MIIMGIRRAHSLSVDNLRFARGTDLVLRWRTLKAMKKLIILVVLLAAGGFGYYFWKNGPKTKVAAQGTGRPSTASVEARNIRFVLTAAGDIGPADQVSV